MIVVACVVAGWLIGVGIIIMFMMGACADGPEA